MKFYEINKKSLEENGIKTYQELWDLKKKDFKGFSMELPTAFEFKKIIVKDVDGSDKEETIYTMVSSTSDMDRHGDIVIQNWVLDSFNKNPVLLDSHNYDSIVHILGKLNNNRIEDGKLKHELEFALMNPKGELAKKMVDGGFINASSVGFIPLEFSNDGVILKSELLEVSLVSVPANGNALFEKMLKQETVKEDFIVAEPKREEKKSILSFIVKNLEKLDTQGEESKKKTKRLLFNALRKL
jgi:HK97 family phage prohead protease